MSIATRTGDQGTTALLHGQRVPKDHPQIEAVGACDELNVEIGAARLACGTAEQQALLLAVQRSLVALMGEIACAQDDAAAHMGSRFERVGDGDLEALDQALAALEARGLRFEGWATPGANPSSLAFERARVAARRAERRIAVLTGAGRNVRPLLLKWINRLSDLLWLMAREAESPRA